VSTTSQVRLKADFQHDSVRHQGVEGLRILPRPEWLPESVWPFDTFGLSIDGSSIAVTDVGRGPALLFVHTGTWSFIWRDLILRLSADFRCISLDAPGTGLSTGVPRDQITLESSSHAVTAVIKQLDLRDLVLVVHDLGGPAGIAGAARLAGRVRGIAGINTFAWKPSSAGLRGMLALVGSAPMEGLDAAFGYIPKITATSFGVGRHMDKASRRAFREGMAGQGRRSFHYYMNDARNAERVYMQAGLALTGAFRELPLLTIFGERNDPFKFQARWKELFPAAQQVVIAKGNHFPMCDDPDFVAQTIRAWHREHFSLSLR